MGHQPNLVFGLQGLQLQCSQMAVRVVHLVKIMHLWRLPQQTALEGMRPAAQPLQGGTGQGLGECAAKVGFDDGHVQFQV